MADLRLDPVTGRPVIIARSRALRPSEFARSRAITVPLDCPFCAGREEQTPASLAVYPQAAADHLGGGKADWLVRVVPNKYPAIGQEPGGDVEHPTPATPAPGNLAELFPLVRGGGRHEVIVETPRHVTSFSQLTLEEAGASFAAYQDRLGAAASEPGCRSAVVFKNVGAEAGASLAHSHSQLLALPLVPPVLGMELSGAQSYRVRNGRCVYCDVLFAELKQRERIVKQSEHFVAFCPYASFQPYEVCILPRRHAARFADLPPAQLTEAAGLVQEIIARLEQLLQSPAYNFVIHSAPFDNDPHDHYHWHIELFPRQTRLAGLELGSQCYINAVSPEAAAAALSG